MQARLWRSRSKRHLSKPTNSRRTLCKALVRPRPDSGFPCEYYGFLEMLLRMTLETRPDWLSLCLQDGFTYVTGGDPNPGDDKRPYNISNPELFKFAFQAQNVFFFWDDNPICPVREGCQSVNKSTLKPINGWMFVSKHKSLGFYLGFFVILVTRAAMTPPSTTAPTATSWTLRSTQRATAPC